MNTNHRTKVSNILVIGMGCAGLRAAIAAHLAGCDVTIIGKRPWKDAHTVLAAGGINAALGTVDPQDSWQQHFADTWKEGYFLANPRMVEMLAREAPAAITELADWGAHSPGRLTGSWIRGSSAPTNTAAPATPVTIPDVRCSTLWPIR